jgi:hypothetical protein
MRNSTAENLFFNVDRAGRDLEQYYSVEIPVYRLNTVYQFRIWDNEYGALSVLIKDSSDLLNWVKKGDRLKMRYYSHDPGNPYQDLYSELVYLQRQDYGRLRGHYLAGIEIMEDQRDLMLSWPYSPVDWKLIPFNMWSSQYAS